MNSIKGYIIDYNKKLGQGSSGDVFLGINSVDGSQYAFKCSKVPAENEVMILRQLDHKNIVKFYDCLKEYGDYHEVIVLEYCNKGSLQEFCHIHMGLCDNMFLLVLECLCEGIEYLRQKHFIHRDIKPEHMMVHEDNMGHFHVKICDLGDAKKVEDNETFRSLVGTPEYLNPEMYFRYLSESSSEASCEASCGASCEESCGEHRCNMDLWSMAVTLYQSVTTYLPFKPFNVDYSQEGYENGLKAMYEKRKPGVISGVQNSADINDIEWSSSLPRNVKLSPMLNDLASKLIGSLMKLDAANSFDRFFKEAHQILNKKRIMMFNSWNGQLELLYLDDLSHKAVWDQITSLTNHYSQNVILLTKQRRLNSARDRYLRPVPVKGHLKFQLTDDTVLVMTNMADNEMQPLFEHDISDTKSDKCDGLSESYENFEDITEYSETLMSDIYEIRRTSNYIDCQIECYEATVASFSKNVIMDNLRLMKAALPWQMKTTMDVCTMTDSLVNIISLATRGTVGCADALVKCKEEIEQLKIKAFEGEKCENQYYGLIVERSQMLNYAGFGSGDEEVSRDNLDFLTHLAEELQHEIRLVPHHKRQKDDEMIFYKLEVWQRLIQLSKIYDASREKMLAKKLMIETKHEAFYRWVKQGHVVMDRIMLLQDFLQGLEKRRLLLRSKFTQMDGLLQKLLFDKNSDHRGPCQASSNMAGRDTIKDRLTEVKQLAESIQKIYLQDSPSGM